MKKFAIVLFLILTLTPAYGHAYSFVDLAVDSRGNGLVIFDKTGGTENFPEKIIVEFVNERGNRHSSDVIYPTFRGPSTVVFSLHKKFTRFQFGLKVFTSDGKVTFLKIH